MPFELTQPTSFNFLQRNNYRFVFNRLPATTFFAQRFTLPEIFFPPIKTGTPFIKLNYSASELEFGELEVEFKVDENFQNFNEIFSWMQGLGFPEDTTQYADIKKNPDGSHGLRSDASVQILTSSDVPNQEIFFRDVFPIFLSGPTFDTRNAETNYITAVVRFSIRDYIIKDVVS